jgi:hypothetical protein
VPDYLQRKKSQKGTDVFMGTFYKAKKKKIVLLTCELVVELAKSSL